MEGGASDRGVLELLGRLGAMSVGDLGRELGVTATAVRQRLNRLLGERLVEKVAVRPAIGTGAAGSGTVGRGRPGHRYVLSDKGRRQSGTNFADLALVLWDEIKSVPDPEVRKGLLQRLAKRLANVYAGKIRGTTLSERLESLRELFAERNVPLEIGGTAELPILSAVACPYPELAAKDRTVCSLEKMLFSELLGETVRLAECRLDGAPCCTFERTAVS